MPLMKPALILVLGGTLIVFLFIRGAGWLKENPGSSLADLPPRALLSSPETRTKTVSFMPGQAVNLPNRKFRKIEVRSEYPLRVLVGPCHSDYTVEFFCESEPADIFIVDTRRTPIFLTPRANNVTITATSY